MSGRDDQTLMEGHMPPATVAPDQDSGAAGPLAELAPEQRWQRVFPGDGRELAVLRRWLATLLPECPARDDVIAVASELAGNAVAHTASGLGGRFTVEITWRPSAVMVAVADGGAPTGPRVIDDPDGERGRGMLVVLDLSARTEVRGDHRGRLVSAEIRWDGPGRPVPGPGPDPHEASADDDQASLAMRSQIAPAWSSQPRLPGDGHDQPDATRRGRLRAPFGGWAAHPDLAGALAGC